MTGNQFVVERLFHPKHPERIKYDSEISSKSKNKFWGPLTKPKIILPNLMPIPLFILGAVSSRQLVSSTVTDIGGMSFALDTSLFWMQSLAIPDTTMAIIAATSGLVSFHLTQCGTRTDFNVKRMYLNVSEVVFYSPDNPNMYEVRKLFKRFSMITCQFSSKMPKIVKIVEMNSLCLLCYNQYQFQKDTQRSLLADLVCWHFGFQISSRQLFRFIHLFILLCEFCLKCYYFPILDEINSFHILIMPLKLK